MESKNLGVGEELKCSRLPSRIEMRYRDVGRDAIQKRAMADALIALIRAINQQ
jgi:hypothetical protein